MFWQQRQLVALMTPKNSFWLTIDTTLIKKTCIMGFLSIVTSHSKNRT